MVAQSKNVVSAGNQPAKSLIGSVNSGGYTALANLPVGVVVGPAAVGAAGSLGAPAGGIPPVLVLQGVKLGALHPSKASPGVVLPYPDSSIPGLN